MAPHKSSLLTLYFLLAATHAGAADLEPRAYSNAPVGLNFVIAGYAYSQGGLSTDALPLQDAQLKINTEAFAYARTLDLWGNSGKFDLVVPYAGLSGSALVAGQPQERNVSGLLDPRLRLSVNFYGSPALSMQEFGKYRQDLIVGGSVQVAAPLGQYEPSRLINLGNHRWFIKPEMGISKAFGALTLELAEAVTFFTSNDNYFGGKTLEQAPLSSTQVHLVYDFGRGVWGALDATYDYGGHTTVNGVDANDRQENSRAGLTLAMPVNRNNSIKFYYSAGVATRTGSDYKLGGMFWQYRWGNGL